MQFSNKQACMIIAAAVSVCFLVCLISTVQVVLAARANGGSIPLGMVMLTLVTLLCAALIWKGVRDMD